MRKIYTLLLWCFCTNILLAQQIVKGTVTDGNTLEVLPGAIIIEKGTNNVTSTDSEGKYTITVNDTATLVFNYIGYTIIEEKVNGRIVINQTLMPNGELDEIVVTALSLKRDARKLGYAVQKIEAKEVAEVKSPNFVLYTRTY